MSASSQVHDGCELIQINPNPQRPNLQKISHFDIERDGFYGCVSPVVEPHQMASNIGIMDNSALICEELVEGL